MVAAIPIALGPLDAGGCIAQRSGIRWLVPDRHHCRQGEVVAFCNIGLTPKAGLPRASHQAFADEVRDLQITFATEFAGVLHQQPDASLGGDLDQLHFYQIWRDEDVVGALVPDEEQDDDGARATTSVWRIGFAAGRRMTELAEDRSGLLTGWHNRSRAWHGQAGPHATVLSLGICEQNGIFRGDSNAFLDMLEISPGALHVVHISDEALVPSACVLNSQLHRDPATREAIAADMALGIFGNGIAPRPADFVFAGCALQALNSDPLGETYDLLTRQGLVSGAAVQAVVLSINAEPAMVLRHRRLGYYAFWHRFRVQAGGPALREWLQTNFEKVKRSLDDIKADLLALRRNLAARGVEHMLILNAMSSSGHEDIFSYAAFDGALGDQLGSIRVKELNLMLHELAEQSEIAIVDVDAIATMLGGADHLPDGVHQSRRLQGKVRAEILHILAQRGLFDGGT